MLTNKLMGGVGGPSDPYFVNVSLLLHGDGTNGAQNNTFLDSSANSFTITRNGNTTQGTFSPFNTTTPYNPAVNGGSGYFPTTTSKLRTTSFATGVGPWTVEAWFYFPSALPDYYSFFALGDADNASSWVMYKAAWNSGNVAFYSNASYASFSPSLITIGAWNHIVLQCGSSRDVRFFVNGVQASSATFAADRTFNSTTFEINGYARGDIYGAVCYIASPRVVVGTAVYGGTFTPPSLAPLSTSGSSSAACYPSTTNVNTSFASSQTKLLLNFTNAGIFDNAMKNDLETVGNAQVSTSVKKYGTGSMYFDGTGDWLIAPSSVNLTPGTGDFTFEAWVYPTSYSNAYHVLFSSSGNGGLFIATENTNFIVRAYNVSTQLTYSSRPTLNTWTHVAISRASGTLRLFYDGVLVTSASSNYSYTQNIQYIGGEPSVNSWNGYIDDLRITKGVARYTANFTPPTAAFPDQ